MILIRLEIMTDQGAGGGLANIGQIVDRWDSNIIGENDLAR